MKRNLIMKLFSLSISFLLIFPAFSQIKKEFELHENILKVNLSHPDSAFIYQKCYNIAEDSILIMEGRLDEKGRSHLWVINYYPNGIIASEGNFIHGLQDGVWYYFHQNSELKEEVHYKNGGLNVWAKVYDELRNLTEEGNYVDGLKGGYWYYFKNGEIWQEGYYDDGIKTGSWKIYENEKLKSVEGYLD